MSRCHSHKIKTIIKVDSAFTVVKVLADGAYYILPNLERLNYKTRVVHHLAIPDQELGLSFIYAVCYAALILTAAVFIFERRDIT